MRWRPAPIWPERPCQRRRTHETHRTERSRPAPQGAVPETEGNRKRDGLVQSGNGGQIGHFFPRKTLGQKASGLRRRCGRCTARAVSGNDGQSSDVRAQVTFQRLLEL